MGKRTYADIDDLGRDNAMDSGEETSLSQESGEESQLMSNLGITSMDDLADLLF